MKFCTFILFFLSPLFANSQDSPYRSFKLYNNQVNYEQVFDCDSMSINDIENMLVAGIPKLKGIKDFNKEGSVITARFADASIDYRRFGGKWGSTPALLNHPFSANVTVQWKEKKYKVTLTNIVFHTAGFGDMSMDLMLTKRKGTIWDMSKGALQVGGYSEKYFTELFIIQPEDNW